MNQPISRTLSILWIAFFAGQALFIGMSLLMPKTTPPAMAGKEFGYIAIGLAITGIVLSRIVYQQKKKAFNMAAPTNEQEIQSRVRTAFIVSCAVSEGPTIIATVFYIMTNDMMCIAAAGLSLAGFLLTFPSAEKLRNDWNISEGY